MRKTVTVVAGLPLLIAMATSAKAANVLFVHDLDASGDGSVAVNAAADTAMIGRLNALGHSVTLIDDSVVTAAAVAGLSGSDFVALSSTASSGTFATNDSGDGNSGAVNSLGTAATVVLMEGGNAVLGAFNLNGSSGLGTRTGTDITILADDGYVTAGLPLGSLSIYGSSSNIGTFGSVFPQGAGLFAPQFDFLGTALASVPDGGFPVDDVTTGTHAVGDNTIVVLPFHNGSFSNVNANGLQLFDNVFGTVVPEPSSMLLMFGGLSAMAVLRRRREV